MSNYPKALYLGSQIKREMVTAENEAHEAELREAGYMDFIDLPEKLETEDQKDADFVNNNNEELTSLKEELVNALKENAVLKKENTILKFNAMDAKELKEILDSKGLTYGSRDGKAELVELVINAEFPTKGE